MSSPQSGLSDIETNAVLFQQLVDTVEDVFCVSDGPTGKTVYVNSAYQRLFDRTPDSLYADSQSRIEAIHPADRAQLVEATTNMGHDTVTVEFRVLHQDGTVHWIRERIFPIFDAQGQLVRRVAVMHDISTDKITEANQRFLIEAGQILASSLDYEATLQNIAQLAVPRVADWCVINLLDEHGELPEVALVYPDAHKEAIVIELREKYPPADEQAGAAWQVVNSGQAVLYERVTDEMLVAATTDAYHLKLVRELELKSVFSVPIKVGEQTVGVFNLSYSTRYITPQDIFLAEKLAQRAGVAIQNARFYKAEQQARQAAELHAERLRRMQAVTTSLSALLDPHEVASVALKEIMGALGANRGVVMGVDGRTVEILYYEGYDPQLMEQWKYFSLDTPTPMGEAIRTGQAVWAESAAELWTKYPLLGRAATVEFGASAAVPLVINQQVIGGIFVGFAGERQFNLAERGFILGVVQQAAQALERGRLYNAATLERERLRVTLASIGDAVIATDMTGAVSFLNTIAQELTGWNEADAIGLPLKQVFHIINESSYELVENPFEKVVQAGGVVGLANHTLLVARDGTRIPIDDSGAPIRDETGEMIGVILVFRDISERKQMEDAEKHQMILEERQRLSHDLHDAVSQMLFASSVIAEALSRQAPSGMATEKLALNLDRLYRLNRGALAEMRTLLFELREDLQTLELTELLQHLANATMGRTQVNVTLDVTKDHALPTEVQIAFYRIAQEALQNVVRHAHASEITIQLRHEDGQTGQTKMTIQDNGQGFNPAEVPASHLGVKVMQERATSAGAVATVESAAGQGTIVTVTWPPV